MRRWLVVWQASLLFVSGTLDVRFLNSRYASSQFDCFEYSEPLPIRTFDAGWGLPRKSAKMIHSTAEIYRPTPVIHDISRRIDFLLSNREDIIKEHAKLVQDINSLKQVIFVAPITDESKDYEDSIFNEIIETTSTTTSRPSTTKSLKPTKTGIPILLLGGASRQHTLKNSPLKNQRQTLSLVGTSVSPLVRHPYPIMTAASQRQPVRICMSSPFSYVTTTRHPSLWERILKSVVPR
ncbi:unnamed protein product [Euphydryas editha]|uniref:Uncharacterized protein n=1 Tax=Euphydryas editha TaxID=104508 RepID=A0AAU9UV23_EUPED|nr:unnamed protein product [Euphydryas editha]